MRTFTNALVKLLESALIVAFAALVLDVLWGVFSRYVIGSQSQWTEELAIYLLIWVSLLGACLTYREKGHLGVDFFMRHLEPGAARLAEGFGILVVALFALLVLIAGGVQLVLETFRSGQVAPSLGIYKGYVYLVAPISGVFFLLFAGEHFLALLGNKNEEDR